MTIQCKRTQYNAFVIVIVIITVYVRFIVIIIIIIVIVTVMADVHVVICPAALLRFSRLPRASRLRQQLCRAALRRLTFYACARFWSSSAAWFGAQAQFVGFLSSSAAWFISWRRRVLLLYHLSELDVIGVLQPVPIPDHAVPALEPSGI